MENVITFWSGLLNARDGKSYDPTIQMRRLICICCEALLGSFLYGTAHFYLFIMLLGSKLLSSYGEEFFRSLEKLVHDHQVKRDREASHNDDIRQEQEKLDLELREILEEQEARLQDSLIKTSVKDDSLVQDDDKEKLDIKAKNNSESMHSDKIKTEKEERHRMHSPVVDTSRKSGATMKSGRKKKSESSMEKRPEWNNDFTFQFSHLSLDSSEETGSSEFVSQESTPGLKNQDMFKSGNDIDLTGDVMKDSNLANEEQSTKPSKLKKKPNYIPNTFVPNRTLQLRRSGSLNKLTDPKLEYQIHKTGDQSATGNNKTEEQFTEGRKPSGKEQVRAQSRDRAGAKLPPKKPAFR